MKILIDNQEVHAEPGQMLIDVADSKGISVPRFCYHKYLSVAANCRMCLMEVEGYKKAVPACATAVSEGMVVKTQSQLTKEAQKSVMEFLLINHPLDCPICDQGGECELQDVSMGFGQKVSRFAEKKRVIPAKNIGPLIHTDLTRCIHCTRCVRFGREIAGIMELGMCGRGEHSEISAFLEKNIDSEMSGNVIDLCPVGALTSAPFRYSARSWEIKARKGIAGHDSTGSHLYYHVKGNSVKRVVPRENEELNEVWLSDRDRFSYEGINANNRLLIPKIKVNGVWRDSEWSTILPEVVDNLKQCEGSLVSRISPNATVEEMYLTQLITRHLGSNNIDHRINQIDFSGQEDWAFSPHSSVTMSDIEEASTVLVVGSDICAEHPMIAHRLRKNTNNIVKQNKEKEKAGQRKVKLPVIQLNVKAFDFHIPTHQWVEEISHWSEEISSLIKAILYEQKKGDLIAELDLDLVNIDTNHKQFAEQLLTNKKPLILLGNYVTQHENFSQIFAQCELLAKLIEGICFWLPPYSNSIGGWVTGCVPHRQIGDKQLFTNDGNLINQKSKVLLSIGLEVGVDFIENSEKVIALTSHETIALRKNADLLLPVTCLAETSGTLINFNNQWQSFSAVVNPPEEVKSTWKLLRVLACELGIENCEYTCAGKILQDIKKEALDLPNTSKLKVGKYVAKTKKQNNLPTIVYRQSPFLSDLQVRNAQALQQTQIAKFFAQFILHPKTAESLNISPQSVAHIQIREKEYGVDIVFDETINESVMLAPSQLLLTSDDLEGDEWVNWQSYEKIRMIEHYWL